MHIRNQSVCRQSWERWGSFGRDVATSGFMKATVVHMAEPPGGGRQDHRAMHVGARRPISGPGSTDTLAASGGLELPGHVPQWTDEETIAPVPEPIPGERDPGTLTWREPGAIGGRFSGADNPPSDPSAWMDEETRRQHTIEGGG
jgi:hypothetical protein